mmetsp:Transcript_28532/g.27321  ORF Transcript_28532/g.27321 Transcript_28532/m.27321 type:complete len:521 (+) Transcript_28532:183-1745(+)
MVTVTRKDEDNNKLLSKLNMIKSDAPKTVALRASSKIPPISRFQRKRFGIPTGLDPISGLQNTDNQLQLSNESDFCQKLLCDGYVQSFVDFYHLTRRADPQSDDRIVTNTVAQLTFIRDNLVSAEVSRRQGNTFNVYAAYGRLADLYVKTMDWRTSIFFHEKCLEVAQLTADARAEMTANHALGVVYQKMTEFETAQKFHERHEEVAMLYDVVEEVAKANTELYKVYTVLARHLESVGKLPEALKIYETCLESAKKSFDKRAEGEANGKIGTLLLQGGDAAKCIPYLKEQCHIAQEMGNAEGKCNACSALALAFDSLGQAEKALTELTLVHGISEQAGDPMLQSKACRALGTLYSKVGKLEAAFESLKKHYSLVNSAFSKITDTSDRKSSSSGAAEKLQGEVAALNLASPNALVTVKDLDLARAYVGIAKGNLLMGTYIVTIHLDLTSLLDWKLTRSELPEQEKQNSKIRGKKVLIVESIEEKETEIGEIFDGIIQKDTEFLEENIETSEIAIEPTDSAR